MPPETTSLNYIWKHVTIQYGHLQANNIKLFFINLILLAWKWPYRVETWCSTKVYNIQ